MLRARSSDNAVMGREHAPVASPKPDPDPRPRAYS